MDIGKAFNDAWSIYSKNAITIILSFLVTAILSIITIGILATPLFTGFQMLFVKAKRGEAVELKNIFDPLKNFLNLIIAGLIVFVIVVLIYIIPMLFYRFGLDTLGRTVNLVAMLALIYLYVSIMYAFLMIQDKGLAPKEALFASKDLVAKNNFWMHLLFLVLVGIVYVIPVIIPTLGFILMFLTGSYACGVLACAYENEAK